MNTRLFPIALLFLVASAASAQGPIPVHVITPTATTLRDTLRMPGTVLAREAITLRAPVSEVVNAVHFREGERVEAGTLLVELVRADEKAMLAMATAEREDARLALKRIDELARSRAVSQSDRDTAKVRVLSADAQVAAAQAALADREIRAPFSGRLGLSDVAVGSYLSAGDMITTLHDVSELEVEFDLPQAQLPLLTPEAQLRFRLPSGGVERWWEATLASSASALDMQQRSLRIRARAVAATELRPGLAVVVELQAASRAALTIPEAALVPRGGEQFVYRINAEDKAEFVKVQTGQRNNGQVEIRDGLTDTDRVVVRGADRLRPGGSVTVRASADAPASTS
ncbi:MAG: efflux RND transporter periplasmic adaptor subunit [Oceanococcaceae bacterium]